MDTKFFCFNDIDYAQIEIKDMVLIDRNDLISSQSYMFFEPIDEDGNINLKQIVKHYNNIVELNKDREQPGYLNEGQKAEYVTSIKIVGMYIKPAQNKEDYPHPRNYLRDPESIQKRNEAMSFYAVYEKIKDDPYRGKTHDEFLSENKEMMEKIYDGMPTDKYLLNCSRDFEKEFLDRSQEFKEKQINSALKELDND